jgi:hypothetical protein
MTVNSLAGEHKAFERGMSDPLTLTLSRRERGPVKDANGIA